MAGMKGRSGGARPGAGRKAAPTAPNHAADPLAFLLSVMRGELEPSARQMTAAVVAARYMHRLAGEAGKKDERAEAAKKAATGKFRPAQSPVMLLPQSCLGGGDAIAGAASVRDCYRSACT